MRELDPIDLAHAGGGMKVDRLRASYNVEDRPPRWGQVLDTWWTNVRSGHLW